MRVGVAVLAGVFVATAACSTSRGKDGKPVDRMFDANYEAFIADAKAHKGTCEISISARGDGGEQSNGLTTTVEVDDEGSFRVEREGAFELVRVGSVAWQRSAGGKFERIESGARSDLTRDDAIAAWRDVLAPLRERLDLAKQGSRKLGDRTIDEYAITAEAGGGADGGLQIVEAKGAVGLDAETGFPVSLTFEGAWEGPATPPAEGRVTWTVEKLACSVSELGGVPAITPAIATPTVAPTTTPVKATATPKPTKKPAR